MDGISGPDSDPEFILIATTSNDFARNLRSSVKRYVGAGDAAEPWCSPLRVRSLETDAYACSRS